MPTIDMVVQSREQAYEAACRAYEVAKHLIAEGKRAHIRAEPDEDDRTLKQNRYYWGVILKEIAEQASIEGQRWCAEAWHELMKRQFLGYEIRKVRVAGRNRPVVIRRLRSTTDLSVAKFNKYLDQVMAFAVTDHGVQFSSDWWE